MCCHSQAERTRAEKQVQQKDAEIQNINTELQRTRTQKDAMVQQRTRELEFERVKVNVIATIVTVIVTCVGGSKAPPVLYIRYT